MPEEAGQERTEQATQKRREETRRRGQVARSLEVNAAIMLLASFSVLAIFGGRFVNRFVSLMVGTLRSAATYTLTADVVQNLLLGTMLQYFIIMLPLFVVLVIMAILTNVIQVGFLITGEPLKPNLEKISPAAGFKRLFSKRSLEMLARDILKVVVVGWIAYAAIGGAVGSILSMSGAEPAAILRFTGQTIFSIAMKILIGYAVLAVLDYAFQRWDYEQSMRMTRQELREEMKETEGDPLIRARVRSVQREMARRRMMEQVPEAAVVVTNPTEFAVALKYEAGMPAPQVVAKGRRHLAERIREIAVEHDIPIVQNVGLAQSLYKAVDIGHFIPADLFTAVAEVLAYVYKLRGKQAG